MRGLLALADRLLETLHWVLILFCAIGWILPQTRMAHLGLVVLIAFSWFGLGLFRGLGFCVLTDLQWKVKRLLGQSPGSRSFVINELEQFVRIPLNQGFVDRVVEIGFYLAAFLSLYVNFVLR